MNNNEFMLAADGWVQVTPCGEYPHKGAGVTQVIDREASEKMVSDFSAHKAVENFPGVLVDFDHFSLDTDKPSEAAGWISELEARDDGLWARVRWSDAGLSAVTGGRYRLLSPVFRHPGGTEDLGEGRVRPVVLESVALTNEPNIKGGKPIANRGTEVRGQRPEDGGEAPDGTTTNGDVSRIDAENAEVGDRERGLVNREVTEAEAAGKKPGAVADKVAEELPGSAMSGPGAKKFMWLLGDPPKGPHCGECASRNGQVKTLLEWLRMPAPKCHCYCRLVEVGKETEDRGQKTEDGSRRTDGDGVMNRWAKPWGDKARAASLAVRRAKAAARASQGGTYADGQPVIRDLTDLPAPSTGTSMSDAGAMEARQAAYTEALRNWLEGVDAVAGSIEGFNALVASAGGAAVAASGGAAPAGAASRAFGAGGVQTAGSYGRRSPALAAKLREMADKMKSSKPYVPHPDPEVEAVRAVERAKADYRDRLVRERALLTDAILQLRGSSGDPKGKDLVGLGASHLRDYLLRLGGRPDVVAPRREVPAGPAPTFEQLKALYGVPAHKLRTPEKYQPKATPEEVREGMRDYLKETLGDRRGTVEQNLRELEVYQRLTARAVVQAKDGLRDAHHAVSEARRVNGEKSPEFAKAQKAAEDALWDLEHATRSNDRNSAELRQLRMNLAEFEQKVREGNPIDWGPLDGDVNRLLEEARRSGGALGNRWKYGWGDVARAASLAVRKAKAAARKTDDAFSEFLTGGIVAGEKPAPGIAKSSAKTALPKDAAEKQVGTKRRSKAKLKKCGTLLISNRWYTHWGDKARAASLAVRRAKAAARASSGGTYADGQPVIRDLTDIGSDYTGDTYITDADPVIERQRQYEDAFRQWWSGVETSAGNIEKFHAYVAALGGATAAAAGSARPAGEATGLFGATGGRYGGQKPVYDQSGNVAGWAKVGGRPAAARRSARTVREPHSSDPLNEPKSHADLAVREAYSRHLETLQRRHESEMVAKGLDPQGYPLWLSRASADLDRIIPAAREADRLFKALRLMDPATSQEREAFEAAKEGLSRFTDLFGQDMVERADKEGILPMVREAVEEYNRLRAGGSGSRETPASYPDEEVPYFAAPSGGVKENAATYSGSLSANAARDAARALGVLHGAYGVGEDGVEIPEALRNEYELGRVEGAKGYDYGIVSPKDRAAVLRGAQAYLDGAAGEDDGYAPDHLNDRFNLEKWESASKWAARNLDGKGVYDPRTPDMRGQYNPASLMRTAMEWFRDAMVRCDRDESNAALSYMSDMLVALSADRNAAVEAARGGAEGDDEDAPEVDATMPVYDEDGVEIGGDEPFFEDSYADPNARMPWEWLGNRWSDAARAAARASRKANGWGGGGWSDAARAAALAVRRSKTAARNAADDLQVDGPVIQEPLAAALPTVRDDALEDYLKRKRRLEANKTRKAQGKSTLQDERDARRERRNASLKEKFDAPGLKEKFGGPGLIAKFAAANEAINRDRLKDKYAKSNPVVPAQGFSVPVKGALYYYNGSFYDKDGKWVAKAKPTQKSGAVWQNGLWYDAATGRTLGRTVAAS